MADGGLHEMNRGIAQAVGDDVVTEGGLHVGLTSELPQRGGESPVELANGERFVVSHPLQQLLVAPRLGARLFRSSLDSHRSTLLCHPEPSGEGSRLSR